jgi:hypothetical protein
LPHSEIRGSTGARPSPRLFAACHVLHRLSVPRHPPDALLIKLAHAQPQARGEAACREQRTDDRGQTKMPELPTSLLFSGLCDLVSGAKRKPPRLAALAIAYPCPGPARRNGWACFTVTTRFTMSESRRQRTEDTVRRAHSPSQTRGPDRRRQAQRPSDLCPLSSEPGGPGPTRTADLTLIRRAL